MASLIDAVARMALNRRPPVAASCLARMASTTARLASVSPGLRRVLAVGLVVVDVEAQDVAVLDGVGDRVLVQRLLEEVLRGLAASERRLRCCLYGGVLLEDGRAGEAEELGLGEELLDGLVVVAELRAVALVEDEDHALVAQRLEPLAVVPARFAVRRARRPSFWMVQTMTLSAASSESRRRTSAPVLVFSSTQPSWKRLNSSRVWRSRSLRSTTNRHFSMSGLALSSVEALKLVSVLPLPVVCQT